MKVNDLKVEKLAAGGGRNPRLAWYSVSHEGRLVGFVEKLQNTRSTINPWKAFAANPDGTFGRYLGAYYGAGGMGSALGFIIDILI